MLEKETGAVTVEVRSNNEKLLQCAIKVVVVLVSFVAVLGGNGTVLATVSPDTSTSAPAEGTTPLVPTYPLPPGGKICFYLYLYFYFLVF